MNVTHTPGPWGYEASGGEPPEWEIAPAADIAESNWTREVAMTASGNEADARLIAAAPELLAALKQIHTCACYTQENQDARDAMLLAIGDAARAAIQKAEPSR